MKSPQIFVAGKKRKKEKNQEKDTNQRSTEVIQGISKLS
jgi:hypothetical protein